MPSKTSVLTVILIILGLLSAVLVNVVTNPDVIIPGLSIGYDLEIHDEFAYVSNNDGVVVIDIHNHNDPIRVTQIQFDHGAFGLEVINDTLYVGALSEGLAIVDISTPLSPEILEVHSSVDGIQNLFVTGNHVYVVKLSGILQIIDISDSSDPSILSSLEVGSYCLDVFVIGDVAYVADSDGLVVVDVSDPTSPDAIRTVPYTNSAFDISVYEETLYLGCHYMGVRILDISSPEDPAFLSSYNEIGEIYGVFGNGECLALADLLEGAKLLNVTDPENPTLIAEYENAAPHDVYYDGVYTYLADQDKEFILISFQDTSTYAYAVTTPSDIWLWTIPITFLSLGVLLVIQPLLKRRMSD